MRQGNMVGKFKVDIGTVYDNFGTSPNLFTFRVWVLMALKIDHFLLFWLRDSFFGDGALFFFAGLETSIAGVMIQSFEVCGFPFRGFCVIFWTFSGHATPVFENRNHSGKL